MYLSSQLVTNWFCVCDVLVIWSQIGSMSESIKLFDHKLVLCVFQVICSLIGSVCAMS
jgi:hypothetical protein